MNDQQEITPEQLRSLLRYEPETGEMYWLARTPDMFEDGIKNSSTDKCKSWNIKFAGKAACASALTTGYLSGKIWGRTYRSHKIAWTLFYGKWPENHLDHINGNRSDNRIGNLREVSMSENMRNAKTPRTNTSGVIGVYWHSGRSKWVARINDGGKRISLGCFDSLHDAADARARAEVKHGYHENHGRIAGGSGHE